MEDFQVKDSWTKDKTDSMWYRSSDHEPVRVVNYKGRTWSMYPFGEVSFTYKDERYYCLSECTDIKNDKELGEALDNGDMELWHNNWYEIRPTEDKYFHYVDMGIYDAVFGEPTELDKYTLDWIMELEKQADIEEKK